MQRQRQTGLASQAFEFADKVQASSAPVKAVKERLLQMGEDYADSVNQCERIDRAFIDLADLLIDLGVLIVKAERASREETAEAALQDAESQHMRLIEETGRQAPKQPSDVTSGGDRPTPQAGTPSTARREKT